ncbi:MAG: YggT family protein [Acidobacteriota bacterium]|nr:YggT family protein [Acidobacteriota bacterium]
MVLFANFLIAIAKVIHIILITYIWIIIIRAILSWIPVPSLHSFAVILFYLTEPVLRPFRRIAPPYKLGGIDISPIIVILLIIFLDSFIVKSISIYGMQLLRQQMLSF